jgi:hypothetical protein
VYACAFKCSLISSGQNQMPRVFRVVLLLAQVRGLSIVQVCMFGCVVFVVRCADGMEVEASNGNVYNTRRELI